MSETRKREDFDVSYNELYDTIDIRDKVKGKVYSCRFDAFLLWMTGEQLEEKIHRE